MADYAELVAEFTEITEKCTTAREAVTLLREKGWVDPDGAVAAWGSHLAGWREVNEARYGGRNV